MKHLAVLLVFCTFYFSLSALVPQNLMRFHCEDDTIKINAIISNSDQHSNISNRVIDLAKQFIDCNYVASTLEADKEMLTVNVHEFDCTTFVETVAALTKTVQRNHATWRDFVQNLESIRYRKGTMGNYASRLHYVSDWIVDNIYRGNFKEITTNIDGVTTMTKTLNYMSRNSAKYPALADSANLAEIKKVEMGYRSHLIPYLKKQLFAKKAIYQQLKDGDIIVILSKTEGLDASHVGFITFIDGEPHLLHASKLHGKVCIEQISVDEYLKRHARNAPGVRIIRIVE